MSSLGIDTETSVSFLRHLSHQDMVRLSLDYVYL
jgi:hypothetical protein